MNYNILNNLDTKIELLFLKKNYNQKLTNLKKSYWIFGQSAVGKTTMAIDFASRWLQANNKNLPDLAKEDLQKLDLDTPFFVTEQDFANFVYTKDNARDLIARKNSIKELLQKTDKLLIFDDLGSSYSNDFLNNEISLLLKNRFENNLQTVITTNLTANNVRESYDNRLLAHLKNQKEKGNLVTVKISEFANNDINDCFDFDKFKIEKKVDKKDSFDISRFTEIAKNRKILLTSIVTANNENAFSVALKNCKSEAEKSMVKNLIQKIKNI